ncbi:MAG: serine/threonine protein kinase [Lentisphaeraceae bacterium]|nr:serine/threonine protein kinase [Lentisphaeraceae bacterium]
MNNESYYNKIDSTSTSLYNLALGHDSSHERYTDMEKVGSGAIKNIHRVLDLTSGRPVAMAVPNDGLSKKQIQHFLEEARLTASLEHPNIIQVYDLGFNQHGLPYFTMKLCSSQKLSDLLNETDTSLFQLLDIFLKICDALSYAHNAGALHRDLKPENILLGSFGEVLVCDWGSAQILSDSNLEHEVGQLSRSLTRGTPGFMSPEQSNGETASIVQDIYSLGALLYNILYRKTPTQQNPTKPAVIDSSVPAGLEAICLKAMAADKNQRYQNVEELIKDIKAWMSGFAPQAEGASFHKQLKLLIIRHKTLSLSIAASLLIISLMSFFYIKSLKSKEMQTRKEKNRAENALKLYDMEKENRQRIATMGADYFIKEARNMMNAMANDHAIELLDSLSESDITVEQELKIKTIHGRIAFYRQKFNKAKVLLEDSDDEEIKSLHKLAIEFAGKKASDEKMLGPHDMVELLDRLLSIRKQLAYCIFRDQVLRIEDYHAQVHLIRKMILINNPWLAQINIKLTETEGKYHLDLSNNPEMSNIQPIRQMPLNSLNLSNCAIRGNSLYILSTVPLTELNLSGNNIKNYGFLQYTKQLKRLTLTRNEARSASLKKYKNQLDIITTD